MNDGQKNKRFNSEEDLIDGFSILSFDNYRNLNRFTQSIKDNSFQEVSKCVLKNIVSKRKVKCLDDYKKEIKPKLEPKVDVIPTRITAQRKSKPDISILSLSRYKRKRPDHIKISMNDLEKEILNPSITTPLFINVMPLKRKFEAMEDNLMNESVTFDTIEEDPQVSKDRSDDVMDKGYNAQQDLCSNPFHKDDSITGDNSMTANSTLSPVSVQQIHFMQFEGESMDLNSPEKIELDHDEFEKVDQEKEYADPSDFNHEDLRRVHVECEYEELIDSDKVEHICEKVLHNFDDHDKIDLEDVKLDKSNENIECNQKVLHSEEIEGKVIEEDKLCESDNDMVEDYEGELRVDITHEDVPYIALNKSNVDESLLEEVKEDEAILVNEVIENKSPEDELTEDMHLSNDLDNCGQEVIFEAMKDEEEDDCIIISVGFDPDPKLTNIPISPFFLEIPDLKPAPFLSFDFQSISLSLSSVTPPSLIPAPNQYFTSLDYHDSKFSSINFEFDACPKFKTRKRRQMKSSILKQSTKSKNSSAGNVQINTQLINDRKESVKKSLFGDNNLSKKEGCPLSSHYIKQIISGPPITRWTGPLLPNSTLNSVNYNVKVLKPIATKNYSVIPYSKCYLGSSQCLVRKTMCHVHIAQSIQRKLISDHTSNSSLVNVNSLIKPRALRPITESFNHFQNLSPFNVNQSLRSSSSLHNTALQELPYKKRPIQPYNIPKCSEDYAVLLKPLHKPIHIPNSYSTRFSNSLNMYPNVLLK